MLGILTPPTARRAARSAPPSVAQWAHLVATQLPPVRQPQATGLAWWSLGLVLARSCGRTAVSVFPASRQHRQENTVRQQLRERCSEAPAKRGLPRQALDATTLGDRFVVLAVSVRYRGCAIPVAWAVLPTTAKGPVGTLAVSGDRPLCPQPPVRRPDMACGPGSHSDSS